ncbi:MAG TPA: M48 family metalloprotease [Gemmatimonadales bacterium]|nr:M48 family metalloprotease [Gemmatimonadales bacterium]
MTPQIAAPARVRRLPLGFALGAALAAACAVNPATGRREISLVSESQEISMGEETAKAVRGSIGLVDNSALQSYVGSIGSRLAATSERPGLPWSFEVIDDPEVNAFAAPGGKIFITRGILPFLGSEAELAGVLGHEIGHVTARHTARQITRSQLAQIGLVAGSILSSDFASVAGGVAAGLQVLFLSYSRADESQSDELGFRYMRRTNYDVREMPEVFAALSRVSDLSGGGRLPAWQSSHPDPADRQAKAVERAASVPADSLRNAIVDTDEYIRSIDGIIFGANPRQGYFEQNRFLHPDLKFVYVFPAGWQTQNQPDAVVALSQGKDAVLQLSFAQGSPDAALQQFASQQGVQVAGGQRVTIGGQSGTTAEFQAQTQDGVLRGRVTYLAYDGRTYQLLGYSTAARYGSYASAFMQSMQSFDRLTDPVALNKQPRRLRTIRLTRSMTVEDFQRQYAPSATPALVAAINGVAAGSTLRAGTWAKGVEGTK